MRARVVVADVSDIPHLAATMRAADRDECWAWDGSTPDRALRQSLEASPLAWTGLLDGEPVCMFGAAAPSLLSLRAAPWLLATDRIDEIPSTFARMSRVALRRIAAVWPVLSNWSDARHVRAHAWLAWLGFRFGPAQPMGPHEMPFRPFSLEGWHREDT